MSDLEQFLLDLECDAETNYNLALNTKAERMSAPQQAWKQLPVTFASSAGSKSVDHEVVRNFVLQFN